MKHHSKALLPLLVPVIASIMLFTVWHLLRPDPQTGTKRLTIEVVHGDGTTNPFSIRTDAESLADALLEHGIAAGEETAYGLFLTTCDGETADSSRQQWWRVSSDGEMLMVGVSDEVIADGGMYELTLVTGYE